MFCIQLNGGLGNQMFQYAFGRALSKKHKETFVLDCSVLENHSKTVDYTLREFELKIFPLQAKKASDMELKKFRMSLLSKINLRLHRLFEVPYFFRTQTVSEVEFYSKFRGNMLSSIKTSFIGYWQSEKYFKAIESLIRSDFTFKPELNERNLKVKRRIEDSNSVSIHVRRGDFVDNPSAFETHGVCSLDYYRNAIAEVKNHVNDPVFYIFSDDCNWVRNSNLVGDSHEFIDWNQGKESYIDMQLMSYCKHNIIANSSFSWWGAWLNNYSSKIVIAPKQWFADDVMNAQSHDLIPKNWKKI